MSNSAAWNITRPWLGPEPATRVVNMNKLGRALTGVRRPADQGAVRLQLQSGRDDARPAARARRDGPRRSVHCRLRSGDDRHGRVRRRRFCRPRRFWRRTTSRAATGRSACSSCGPSSMRSANRGRTPRCSASWRAGSICSSSAEPDNELDMLLQIFKTLPGTVGAQMEEIGPRGAAVRLPAHSVRRRAAEDVRSEGRSVSGGARSGSACWVCTRSSRIPRRERFPLALISPASDKTISSTLGELPRPAVALLMHPADAAAARG